MILGAKGLGKVALDIFDQNNVLTYCFLDDDESLHNTQIGEVAVLGGLGDSEFLCYAGDTCEVFVALDEKEYRKSVVEELVEQKKVMPVNCFHPQARISSSAVVGHGNLINGGATIGAFAKVGNHCLINSNALVDFESTIGDFVQLGAGSVVGSEVTLEEGVFVGAGAIIVSGVTVGKDARIGAGSVVIADVGEGETLFGNPAKSVGK